jgi:hypothetical protein
LGGTVPNPLEELTSDRILLKVSERLTIDKTRALWRALESELRESQVAGAETYLASMFSDVLRETKDALDQFKEAARTRN